MDAALDAKQKKDGSSFSRLTRKDPATVSSDKVRNVPTEEGRVLGGKLAQFCDESEPAARLKAPTLLPRCNSCAFREGPHVANGSPETQMDALKCVIEGIEFQCHEPARRGLPCSGWAMMTLAGGLARGAKAPWPFSDEAEA